ncbi:type II secretion system F family protein [Sinomonas sp. ASV322]|uniref:type II secretion system F family protein n=1 Tax=Sinomonas sp. ASV322 TaxID=3041920 RepID=UPI0027DE9ED7|nr:type II secretion system F family protein [Sinomonas sp. ASV322]MDQ4501874.1 type II secretion system F family protein [Sinomonas sp. ASV322]
MDSPIILTVGLTAVYAAMACFVVFVLRSNRGVPLARRRPLAKDAASTLTKLTDGAVGAINKTLHGRQVRFIPVDKFEQAGLKIRAADFLLMCAASFFALGLIGFIFGGLGIAVLAACAGPTILLAWLNLTAARRQSAFAQQLPDTLQMLAGSMRAGHSLLRAVDGAAEESEAPMGEELRRVVNENRIGRELVESLTDTAARMKSQDFLWVAEAIETQREVGGNLAELLDNVNETILDRAKLFRQVKALSAEGRVSALVLVSLPIFMLIMISLINASYAAVFFTTLPGWGMLAASALMLTVGSVWLMRLIKPKY